MPQELELTSVSAGYVRSRVREVMMVAMGCGMGILAWAVARKGGMNAEAGPPTHPYCLLHLWKGVARDAAEGNRRFYPGCNRRQSEA
eukprot:1138716-Pelagomonas_calceolata.AAC.3